MSNVMIKLIDKKKIRADDYVTYFLIFSYIMLVLFYKLEWIMSIIVYPFTALFFYGVLKIIGGINKKNIENSRSINKVLFGIISLTFSALFLGFILTQPNVTNQNIVNLAAFPILIVGFAGIVKGKLVDLYSTLHRVINIIVGFLTILISLFILIFPFFTSRDYFIIYLISLFIILLFNVISRAALYLSEYGLSLIHLKNFKLFFYIISDYLVYIDEDGNIILDKLSSHKKKDDGPFKALKLITDKE